MDQFETKVVRGVTMRKDPAREACFIVADTDDQMISWPEWTDESKRERIHRHMNKMFFIRPWLQNRFSIGLVLQSEL